MALKNPGSVVELQQHLCHHSDIVTQTQSKLENVKKQDIAHITTISHLITTLEQNP
jgi:hypothetical protein